MSEVLEVSIPEMDLDPFSDEFLSEPYRLHEIMREAGPVVRLTRYGILGFARYADIRSILLDWQTFCSSAGVGITNFRNETPWRPPSVLLEADPPLHDRTRGVSQPHHVSGLVAQPARKVRARGGCPCRRTRSARRDRCRCGPRRAISREGIF